MTEIGYITDKNDILWKLPPETKVCPKTLAAGGHEDPKFYACGKERCEWWDPHEEQCSIRTIAESARLLLRKEDSV